MYAFGGDDEQRVSPFPCRKSLTESASSPGLTGALLHQDVKFLLLREASRALNWCCIASVFMPLTGKVLAFICSPGRREIE